MVLVLNVCVVYCVFVCIVSMSVCSDGVWCLISWISLMLVGVGIDRLSSSMLVMVCLVSVSVFELLFVLLMILKLLVIFRM